MWLLYTKDSDKDDAMIRFVGEFKTKKAAEAEVHEIWKEQPEPRKDIIYNLEKE